MNKQKLVLPISIVLGCIILGGFFYAIQVSEQRSIEKQQQLELQAEKEKQEADLEARRIELQAEREQQQADSEARQIEIDKQQQALLEKQQEEAQIKSFCAKELERNGNFLVSNETLYANYSKCLHSYGL